MSARRCGAMPTGGAGSSGCAGATTRRTRSALRALSSGSSVARCSPERGSTRSTLERSQRATRRRSCSERAVGGGDFEADALDGDGAVAASLFARDLRAERAPKGIGAGALAADAGAAQVARERASRWISECSLRWYSSSTQACVAVLSSSRVSSGSPSSMGKRRPSICPQNDSCFPFCSGEYGSVV